MTDVRMIGVDLASGDAWITEEEMDGASNIKGAQTNHEWAEKRFGHLVITKENHSPAITSSISGSLKYSGTLIVQFDGPMRIILTLTSPIVVMLIASWLKLTG